MKKKEQGSSKKYKENQHIVVETKRTDFNNRKQATNNDYR